MVEFRGVHKSFGNLEVLKGTNLNVEKGQVVTLIDPLGSGKSTILRCISLLEKPAKGQVFVDGTDIMVPKADIQAVRKSIGMVFQYFNLFPHMTVMENMTYAPVRVSKIPKNEAAKNALGLLRLVGLVEEADTYPGKLSGGQRQRVAIARALAMEPQIMLFDRPTNALDPEVAKEILEVIENLAHTDVTAALVAHEVGFAREVSDRIYSVGDGRIVEDANPDEFFKSPKSDRARRFLERVLQRRHG